MFLSNHFKNRISDYKIRIYIRKVLCIFIFIIPLSCSHPFCEEIKIEEIIPREPQTITFRPGREGKDASISSYYPDSSFAVNESLNLIAWTINRNRIFEKFYMDFDLSSIVPPGAKVTYAVLNLSADTKNEYLGYRGHTIFQVDSVWKINIVTSPWEENDISWFNQPTVDQSKMSVEKGPYIYNQKYYVNITPYVQGKLKKDPNVKGLSFDFYKNVTHNTDCMIKFGSSDHQIEELRPELIIRYNR